MYDVLHYIGIGKADAFRMADIDFDGTISKKDLKQFILKLPHVQAKEVTDPKVDRLFKLLDRFKRGHIQADDFLQIFTEDNTSQLQLNRTQSELFFKSLTSTKLVAEPIFEHTNLQKQDFDWRKNAKQQIGLILSKKFDDLRTGFDSTYHISSQSLTLCSNLRTYG